MEYTDLALFRNSFRAREKGEVEINVRDFLEHPELMNTVESVRRYDDSAERTIRDALELVEQLQEYRAALAKRYAYLSTCPTVPVVKLERERNSYTHKIYYKFRVYRRNVETGAETLETSEQFDGTDRHKAIAKFKKYVKDHPGIEAVMDIEKGRWEK